MRAVRLTFCIRFISYGTQCSFTGTIANSGILTLSQPVFHLLLNEVTNEETLSNHIPSHPIPIPSHSLWTFAPLTFRPLDVSHPGCFSLRTFHPQDVSPSHWTFCLCQWTFRPHPGRNVRVVSSMDSQRSHVRCRSANRKLLINRDHSFPQKILPNSADGFAKFCCPQLAAAKSSKFHGSPWPPIRL